MMNLKPSLPLATMPIRYDKGKEVSIVGFPAAPMCRISGELVKDVGNRIRIVSNTFGGNSGGPVVDEDNELVGLFVWGNTDFDEEGNLRFYEQSEADEQFVPIQKIIDDILWKLSNK